MKNEAQLIWETLQQVKGGSGGEVCPKCGKEHPINASCGVKHEADSHEAEEREPVTRVGGYAKGDPSEFKIGQIIKSARTRDDYDGMIVDIYEEDGELEFALLQVGEEGWSVKASDIRPDSDRDRPRADALPGSKHDYGADPIPGL